MSKLSTGALDITALREILKGNHSGKWKTKAGREMLNIKMWENDQPDQYGNTFCIQANSKSKEDEAKEGKAYLANLKPVESKSDSGQPAAAQSGGEDIPF